MKSGRCQHRCRSWRSSARTDMKSDCNRQQDRRRQVKDTLESIEATHSDIGAMVGGERHSFYLRAGVVFGG